MVKEGDLLAVFNSAHRIMKAESILKSLGLPILLIPAPRKLMTDCGLAIRFDEDNRAVIMNALEHEKMMPEFITKYESGKYINVWTDGNSADAL